MLTKWLDISMIIREKNVEDVLKEAAKIVTPRAGLRKYRRKRKPL